MIKFQKEAQTNCGYNKCFDHYILKNKVKDKFGIKFEQVINEKTE